MSIIADTLKGLQARSSPTTPGVSEEPSFRPPFNQGEGTGRHIKASGMKFWIVGVGMTVGLAGLALSAFWIGLHIDFGLSANTHARMDNSRPVPAPPLPVEIQITTQEPSETVVSADPESVHPPPKSQANEEQALQASMIVTEHSSTQEPSGTVVSTEPEIAQPSSPPRSQANEEQALQTSLIVPEHSPTQDTSSAQTHLESQPVVPPPEPPVIRESSEQQANSTSEQSADRASGQIVPGESSSEELPALAELVHQPTPEVELPPSVEMDIEEAQGPQTTNPETVTLEEEFVHTEELDKTAKLSTNPTDTPSILKKRREAIHSVGQAITPPQLSPANRLRQAQELIQTGHYEEAVALLDPLFQEPPVKWQPWFWMGTALLGQEDLEQADQFFLSGLARNDKIPQLWIQRALVAQQRGNYQLAIYELRQAESLKADLPHIHLNMGYAYEQLGNDRLARQYYVKFLKLSEGNPAFFSIRKKLFARVAPKTETEAERPLPPSVSSLLNP